MRRKILLRNLFFLLGSWISAGTQNVITQVYFAQYNERTKGYLVAITLLVGAIGSMLGIYISKRSLNKDKPLIIWWILFFNVSFTFQYFTGCWWCYIVAHGLTLCLYNGIYNYIDYSFANCTPKEGIDWHSGCLLLYQMLGYTFAPLFFTSLGAHKGVAISILWGIILLVAIIDIPILLKNAAKKQQASEPEHKKLNTLQYLFLAYCVAIQMAIALILAEVMYIMSDYYGFENYGLAGSCYLGIMVIVASSIVIALSVGKQSEVVRLRGKMQMLGVSCLMGSILLVLLKCSHHMAYIILCGIIGGIGYGIYMRLTKDYVVKSSRALKDGAFLTQYNSGQIVSSILAYSVSLIIQWIAQYYRQSIISVVLVTGIGLLSAGVCMLAVLERKLVGGKNSAVQDHTI